MRKDNKGLAPPASQDRATDAPHGAAKASPPSGSVSTGAGDIASAAANSLRPELFEPLVRDLADNLYERLLTGVQDYLIDNAEFNIGEMIAAQRRETEALERLIDELCGAIETGRDYVYDLSAGEDLIAAKLEKQARDDFHRFNRLLDKAKPYRRPAITLRDVIEQAVGDRTPSGDS